MKLFGREAKIVKVKDFDEYAVEVMSYFFGFETVSYQALRRNTHFTFTRLESGFKPWCLGSHDEALKIYNEYYGDFEEAKQ